MRSEFKGDGIYFGGPFLSDNNPMFRVVGKNVDVDLSVGDRCELELEIDRRLLKYLQKIRDCSW